MAKRNDPVSRARGRKPAPVKKPFPTGFVVGSVVLVAFLVGILVYAVQNQGIGDKASLKYACSQIDGLSCEKGLKRNHVGGAVSYPDAKDAPPDGGDHNAVAQTCQVYSAAVANEHAVHSLEHGAVWITYNPDTLSKDDVTKLTKDSDVEGNPYVMVSPYPGLKSKLSLQAWGAQVFLDSVTDKRIGRFIDLFAQGPQTPEPGTQCTGTTATGPLTATPSDGATPMTTGSAPSPSAS
jgi:hypothetical protein